MWAFIRDFPLHLLKAEHYQSSTQRYLTTVLIISYIRTAVSCAAFYLSHSNFQQLWPFYLLPTELTWVSPIEPTVFMLLHNCFPSHKNSWIHNTTVANSYPAIKLYKNYFAFKQFDSFFWCVDTHHNHAYTCNALQY